MKIPVTPLTGIAPTPRKEPDKFIFNTVLDKVIFIFLHDLMCLGGFVKFCSASTIRLVYKYV